MNRVKGTYDLLGKDAEYMQYIESVIKKVMNNRGFSYIRTPVFEESSLYRRSVGEDTDIVSKETYDFEDKGGRHLTLRPEGTAGVVRAYLEEKLYVSPLQPIKLYYIETMYRYESPQAGRFREHTQFGVEIFGDRNKYIEIDAILALVKVLKECGLKDIKLKINCLANPSSRQKYKEKLRDYLKDNLIDLCEDCQKRYQTNILRILDCKVDNSKMILKNIPKIRDYLDEESLDYYKSIKELLDICHINYEEDSNLVRGMDYYDDMVFEIETNINGNMKAVCGGGRYNRLIKELNPSVDKYGFGFAIGLERLIYLMKENGIDLEKKQQVYIFALSESERQFAIMLKDKLSKNFRVEIDLESRSLKSQFKRSDNLHTNHQIFINDKNLINNKVEYKNMQDKQLQLIDIEEIEDIINENNIK